MYLHRLRPFPSTLRVSLNGKYKFEYSVALFPNHFQNFVRYKHSLRNIDVHTGVHRLAMAQSRVACIKTSFSERKLFDSSFFTGNIINFRLNYYNPEKVIDEFTFTPGNYSSRLANRIQDVHKTISATVKIPQSDYPNITFSAIYNRQYLQTLGAKNQSKLMLFGSDLSGKYILVNAENADVLNETVQRLQNEIQELIKDTEHSSEKRNTKQAVVDPLLATVKIPTSEYPNIAFAPILVGKNGYYMLKLERETQSKLKLKNNLSGKYILVTAKNADILNEAVQRLQIEIQELIVKDTEHSSEGRNTKQARVDPLLATVKIPQSEYPNIAFSAMLNGQYLRKLEKETRSVLDFDEENILVTANNTDIMKQTVQRLQNEIQELIKDTEHSSEKRNTKQAGVDPLLATVKIPTSEYPNIAFAPILVGKDGNYMLKLERETQSKLKLKNDNFNEMHILVTAKNADILNEAVQRLQKEIQELIVKDTEHSSEGRNTKQAAVVPLSEAVNIPQREYPNIAFSAIFNRQYLQTLGEQTRSKLMLFGSDLSETYILVNADNTDILKQTTNRLQYVIKDIIKKKKNTKHLSATVKIPQSEHPNIEFSPILLGKHGQNIRKLENQTQSKLQFLNYGLNEKHILVTAKNVEMLNETVTIVQRKIQQVIKNKEHILEEEEKAIKYPTSVSGTVSIPCSKHPKIEFGPILLGKHGQNIKKLERETQSKLKLVRNDFNEIRIIVTAKNTDILNEAVQRLQNEIKELTKNKTSPGPNGAVQVPLSEGVNTYPMIKFETYIKAIPIPMKCKIESFTDNLMRILVGSFLVAPEVKMLSHLSITTCPSAWFILIAAENHYVGKIAAKSIEEGLDNIASEIVEPPMHVKSLMEDIPELLNMSFISEGLRLLAVTGECVINIQKDGIRMTAIDENIFKRKKKEINEIFNRVVSKKIQIPPIQKLNCVDLTVVKFIGTDGKNITKVQNDYNCNIQIPIGLGYILVWAVDSTNLERAVVEVERQLQQIVQNSTLIHLPTSKYQYEKLIVGKDGSMFKKLTKETGALFHMSKADNAVVVSASDAVSLERAVEKMTDIIQQYTQLVEEIEVSLDEKMEVVLLKRNIINELENETGIKIHFNISDNDVTDTGTQKIVVFGQDAGNLAKAVKTINDIVQNRTIFSEEVIFPQLGSQSAINKLMSGSKASWLEKFEKESNVNINFTHGPPPALTVFASSAEQVRAGVEYLNKQLNMRVEIRNLLTKKVWIPESKYEDVNILCSSDDNKKLLEAYERSRNTDIKIMEYNSKEMPHFMVKAKDMFSLKKTELKLQVMMENLNMEAFIDENSTRVDIPQRSYPNINFTSNLVGKDKSLLKQLESETRTFIDYIDERKEPHMLVSGADKYNVNICVNMLHAVIDKMIQRKQNTNLNMNEEKVYLPIREYPDLDFSSIVNQEHGRINAIEKKTKTTISVYDKFSAPHILVEAENAGNLEKAVDELKQEMKMIIKSGSGISQMMKNKTLTFK